MPGLPDSSSMLWVGGGLPPRFRWVSPALVRMLGHSPEEWKARGFVHRLVHPEDLERLVEGWRETGRTGQARTLEFRAASAQGHFVSLAVELHALEPAADGAGELIGTVLSTAPGSEEDLREALARSQRQYAELIDTIDGIVWEADASFRFTFISKQAERLLGYPFQRWLQEPDFWVKHLHPEDREWALAFCRQAVREGRAHEFEYRMVAADGRPVWLRDLVTVVFEAGVPRKLRGIMVDVTGQRQAREHLERTVSLLRATLDSTADGVLVVDQRRRITTFNARFQELWRLPQELLSSREGDSVLAFVLSQVRDPERFRARLQELLAAPEQESIDTLELHDGRLLERYSRPQRLGEFIIGRVWCYRDVTAERRAREERER
ncbi:MAG: PAS domain-containing protein, partial [Archangium sp.]